MSEGNFDDIVAGQFDDVEVPSMDLELASDEELAAEMQEIKDRTRAVIDAKMRRIAFAGIETAREALERPIDGPSFYAGMIYGPCPDELYGEFLEQNRDFVASFDRGLPPVDGE